MNDSSQIRQILEETLSVTISEEWWTACCHAVARPNVVVLAPALSVDTFLAHLLVSDIRDVVRPPTPSNNASRQLQQAIHLSKDPNCPKQQLPSTFHLFCQLEEAVDMSLTQEARLSHDAPKPSRCLKLFLTDGIHNFVAMEVLPFLPQWTPGSKIRLQGPITIRWGLVQLHSGNATFLGGQVEELVKTQAKARELAQKRGGVGVDATIRALIGTTPEEGEEGDGAIDEGEGESGDVVEQVTVPASTAASPLVVPLNHPNQSLPLRRNSGTTAHLSTTDVSTPLPNYNLNPDTQATTRAPPAITSTVPLSTDSERHFRNPYAVGNTPVSSTSARPHVNPYQHRPVGTTTPTNPTFTDSSRFDSTTPTPSRTTTTINPYAASRSSAIINPTNDSNITFTDLRALLLQLVQDPSSFESHLTKTYFVTLIQKGDKVHFNIGKDKLAGKKQYNFEIHATFGVPESPHLIACKLPSRIVEPLFQKTPAELRALTRADRQESNRIVDEGGTRVRQEYFGKLRRWRATIVQGLQAVDDIHSPILILEPV